MTLVPLENIIIKYHKIKLFQEYCYRIGILSGSYSTIYILKYVRSDELVIITNYVQVDNHLS